MPDFSDYAIATRTRDVITQFVQQELNRRRPQVQYGVVNTIDRPGRKCTVTVVGDSTPSTVKMGVIQPASTSQIVRIDGVMGDRFIADVISGQAFVDAAAVANQATTESLELRSTSGNPYIDFTRTPGTGDYNVRIINEVSGWLRLYGQLHVSAGQVRAGTGDNETVIGPWAASASYGMIGSQVRQAADSDHYILLFGGADAATYISPSGTDGAVVIRRESNGTNIALFTKDKVEFTPNGVLKHEFWVDGNYHCTGIGLGGDNVDNTGVWNHNGNYKLIGANRHFLLNDGVSEGGWYMNGDGTWIRSTNDKGVYSGGQLRSGIAVIKTAWFDGNYATFSHSAKTESYDFGYGQASDGHCLISTNSRCRIRRDIGTGDFTLLDMTKTDRDLGWGAIHGVDLRSALVGLTGTTMVIGGLGASDQFGYNTSSRRAKENIRKLQDTYDLTDVGFRTGGPGAATLDIGEGNPLWKMKPKRFSWKSSVIKNADEYNERVPGGFAGLIAEEVAEVAPDAVHLGPDGQPISIDHAAMIGYLVDAVQHIRTALGLRLTEIEHLPVIVMGKPKK